MGRQYFDDAPDVLGQDQAAARDALAGAMAANAERQTLAHEFITSHGGEVSSGHPPLGSHVTDVGADPDAYGADASDT